MQWPLLDSPSSLGFQDTTICCLILRCFCRSPASFQGALGLSTSLLLFAFACPLGDLDRSPLCSLCEDLPHLHDDFHIYVSNLQTLCSPVCLTAPLGNGFKSETQHVSSQSAPHQKSFSAQWMVPPYKSEVCIRKWGFLHITIFSLSQGWGESLKS